VRRSALTSRPEWTVAATGDRVEVARFGAKVVRGPGPADCWLWMGAIADDGYGRFWIRRDGVVRVARPHRYALALALQVGLDDVEVAEHAVCDVPICVRAEGRQGDHIWTSTQAENLAWMGWRGRGGGADWARRFRGGRSGRMCGRVPGATRRRHPRLGRRRHRSRPGPSRR
jgi:hypothetical protein